jgi:GNAT superfamily N-acetyltransferase
MSKSTIRPCGDADFETIWEIINDGAQAYRGVIPPDRLNDPYMSREHLGEEIAGGVRFWACEVDGEAAGVMGIQDVADVTLIRHAYVRARRQGQGIGGGCSRTCDRRRSGLYSSGPGPTPNGRSASTSNMDFA